MKSQLNPRIILKEIRKFRKKIKEEKVREFNKGINPNVKIHCPKHGLQSSNMETAHAIACCKCFPLKK